MPGIAIFFQLVVLIFSIMIHEISHGAMALYLGDDTAKRLGRLTLNPLKHLDPFGSVILPLILVVFHSPVLIGWAKPVPYNPYNLKNPQKGAALIGAAGPVVNIIIAVVFALLLHIPLALNSSTAVAAFGVIILLNLLLAIFNLVPIPPLDGSKVLFALLPASWTQVQRFLEINGILVLLLFIFLGLRFLFGLVLIMFALLLALAGIDAELILSTMVTVFGR